MAPVVLPLEFYEVFRHDPVTFNVIQRLRKSGALVVEPAPKPEPETETVAA
jgi:hypothetical protein